MISPNPQCSPSESDHSLGDVEMMDMLAALVDKSLVVYEEKDGVSRYRLLESVRYYCRARLEESGQYGAFRREHLRYYLALAEEGQQHLAGGEQAEWLDRFEQEHDNFRAALAWCVS